MLLEMLKPLSSLGFTLTPTLLRPLSLSIGMRGNTQTVKQSDTEIFVELK